MVTDADRRITLFSRGAERLTGYRASDVLETSPLRFFEPEELRRAAAAFDTTPDEQAVLHGLSAQEPLTRQWTWRRRDHSHVQVQLTLTPVLDAAGAPTGAVVGVASDISALVDAQEHLRRSEEQFRLAFESAPSGMALLSLAPGHIGALVRVNAAFASFTGRSPRDLVDARMVETLHPEEVASHEAYLQRAVHTGETEPAGVQRRFVRPDGEVRIGRKSTSLLTTDDGAPPHLLVIIEDITAAVAAHELLRHAALHDHLTGLPNRALLTARLREALASSPRQVPPGAAVDDLHAQGHVDQNDDEEGAAEEGGAEADHGPDAAPGRRADRVGVIYMDLDGFKAVNDAHGHAAGDHLLREVATRLASAVRTGDTVARLGGDEFAIVCPGLIPHAAQHLMKRLRACLDPPVVLPNAVTLHLSASIGLVAAEAGQGAAEVLHRADEAMYRAKRRHARP